MKKNRLALRAAAALTLVMLPLLGACGTQPTPEPSPTATPVESASSVAASSSSSAPASVTVTVTTSPPSVEVTATVTATTTEQASQTSAPPLSTVTAGAVIAEVASVHDGDTLTLTDGSKVRVLGIDTPELPTGGNGQPESADQCYGSEAQIKARELMPPGTQVTITPDPAQGAGPEMTDRYGRLLRYVDTPSGDLAALLLQGGFARVYEQYPVARTSQYLSIQTAAQVAQAGLWKECAE